jgi:hypothetical protein
MTAALVRCDHRKKKRGGAGGGEQGGGATVLAVTVVRGEELRGLGLALEASNQIDCQLVQSFPFREYISPITKISKESNPSTKRKPTSHDYANGGGNR